MLEPPLAMMMIGVCLLWPFLIIAVTSISMEFTNTLKEDCENGYIEFRCVVTMTWRWVEELLSISLLKNSIENRVSVSRDGVLKDTELAYRSGVAINSSISDVDKYLIIRIMASEIKPKKDKGLYCCGATVNITNQGLKIFITPWRMLNITEIDCSKQSNKITNKTAGDFNKVVVECASMLTC
uniref:Uncharacterized protein LOC111112324 n=1 Tax=Crassostrea virginica TaxID=6565 RepID=A0A8B8BQ61_CRAVI|nr:uncharacterized protein LOC111112324 [Crassostrea virginica]